jgi:tetratricopeptide (TPR) repeat protein
MKNELDYSVFIERYLDDEMSQDEKLWFIRELRGNPDLKRELGIRESLNTAIHETEIMDFRKQLESVFEESRIELEHKSSHLGHRRRLAVISSSLAVILAGMLWFWLSFHNMSSQKIYDKYFSPAEAGLTFRSEENEDNSELQMAMHFYELGKYEEALPRFERILRDDPTRLGLNLYSGISQMEVKRYQEANRSFQKIINNHYILYLEQAEWYLAFCYLMTDDIKKAREQFMLIENRKGYYHRQAQKILRRI